ncbi:hypothetical protein N473_15135 [Pseudoalteromonas luteoviolacea CPMOR-1]|uniref:Uncharacterized protein n=2 Tax=Pseudoalteromonas luteoviolacea TaxID=43657 RepID=A0A162AZS7_9GAMM|nr:hypothetical protein JF50_02450 [Pseudoalteromonas luteoviolacea]KZN64280.1 hypothetical protein N473_15135 [Pseudoalteromonas luteoviolacea CPMOR-1]
MYQIAWSLYFSGTSSQFWLSDISQHTLIVKHMGEIVLYVIMFLLILTKTNAKKKYMKSAVLLMLSVIVLMTLRALIWPDFIFL